VATKVIKAGTPDKVAAAARQGAKALRAGELVAFATETVYGVAAMATNRSAMERLRELKSRPARPFSVHVGRPEDAHLYVVEPCKLARRLMLKAWPGPVTLLLPVGGKLAEKRLDKAGLYDVLTCDDVIGLRCPDEPVAMAVLLAVAAPVVATSANRAQERSPRSAEDVLAALDGQIDLVIDSGPTRYGKDSTIVRFTPEGGARIARSGVIDARAIGRLLRWRLLLVCTGNTCRSPMAVGLARKLLADKLNCRVAELRRKGLDIVSAGAFATDGLGPMPEAVAAAGKLGADISRHRSRALTGELIRSADVILCMKDSHVAEVLRVVPSAAGRTLRLDEKGDVPDPVGGGGRLYQMIAERIHEALKSRLGGLLTE